MTDYIKLIDAALIGYVESSGAPRGLAGAMEYALFPGGKRLRPCLCLAAADMLGGDIQDALPLAAGLEMIHSYSLIHDDLPCMDDDPVRRGKPSVHIAFGEANAVLAGDGLLSLAFEVMLGDGRRKPESPRYFEAVAAVAAGAGAGGMVAGQSLDILSTGSEGGDIETLRAIHSRKTGALINASVLAGAIFANAGEAELAAMEAFGQSYGLLFQITDDILDAAGDSAAMGKTAGKDAAAGKLTYPALLGLERSRELAAETAEKCMGAMALFGERAGYFRTLVGETVCRVR